MFHLVTNIHSDLPTVTSMMKIYPIGIPTNTLTIPLELNIWILAYFQSNSETITENYVQNDKTI